MCALPHVAATRLSETPYNQQFSARFNFNNSDFASWPVLPFSHCDVIGAVHISANLHTWCMSGGTVFDLSSDGAVRIDEKWGLSVPTDSKFVSLEDSPYGNVAFVSPTSAYILSCSEPSDCALKLTLQMSLRAPITDAAFICSQIVVASAGVLSVIDLPSVSVFDVPDVNQATVLATFNRGQDRAIAVASPLRFYFGAVRGCESALNVTWRFEWIRSFIDDVVADMAFNSKGDLAIATSSEINVRAADGTFHRISVTSSVPFANISSVAVDSDDHVTPSPPPGNPRSSGPPVPLARASGTRTRWPVRSTRRCHLSPS